MPDFGERKGKVVTLTFYPRDLDLAQAVAEYLGVSKAEAMRTAIRHFAAHILPPENRPKA